MRVRKRSSKRALGTASTCPHCGASTYVIDSRIRVRGQLQRRRRCKVDPTHRTSTVEVSADAWEEAQVLLAYYRRVYGTVVFVADPVTKQVHEITI